MKRFVLIGAALLAVLPASGLAASAPAVPTDGGTTPEVIVTATRTPEAAADTGSTVTVIDRQEIEERQYETVSQALEQVPGLSLAPSGTTGQTTGVFTRGLNTNQTLILVNGKRLPQGLDGAFDLTDLTTDNVERIEVARGAFSGVQGANAAGGVINIITRDGRGLEKPEYTATFEAGSFNTFREALTAAGAQGKFDYSVGASMLDTTWQRANNDYDRGNVDAHGGYQITKDLRLTLDATYRDVFAQNPSTIGSPTIGQSWLEQEAWSVSPTLEWKTTEDWTQTVSYLRSQLRLPSRLASAPATATDDLRGQVNANQVNYDTVYRITNRLKINGGFEFRDSDTWQTDSPIPPPGFPSLPYANNETTTAGYGGLDWEPLDGWHIVPGVRADHFSDYGSFVNWRVASSYRVAATKTLLHASYGTSTTPPPDQDFIAFPGFPANPFLTPEQTDGFDAGFDQPLFDGKWTFGLTYFQNNVHNMIISESPDFLPENIDRARTQGVEITSAWHPIAQLDLSASYTYLDARNLTETTSFGGLSVAAGSLLPRRPRNTTTFAVTGRPAKGVSLTVEGSWLAGEEDGDPTTGFPTDVPDYFVARAAASWQITPHVQLFGRLENALNEKYQPVRGYPAPDQAVYGGFKLAY